MSEAVPVVVEFVVGWRVEREVERERRGLPIVGNGPPGTFVRFGDERRVPLPTDQIVLVEEGEGGARVGFGGMRFEGVEEGVLVFRRVKDLWPEEKLSPERGNRMTLGVEMVEAVVVEGKVVWPAVH